MGCRQGRNRAAARIFVAMRRHARSCQMQIKLCQEPPTDPSTRSLRSLGRDDIIQRRYAFSGGMNERHREEDVIPSEAEGGVEESIRLGRRPRSGQACGVGCAFLRDLRILRGRVGRICVYLCDLWASRPGWVGFAPSRLCVFAPLRCGVGGRADRVSSIQYRASCGWAVGSSTAPKN